MTREKVYLTVQRLLEHAREQVEKKDVESAIAYAEQMLVQEPDNADALLLLGTLHLQSGRARAALCYLEKAANTYPDRSDYCQLASQACFLIEKHMDALSYCDKALAIAPSASLYVDSAKVFYQMKDYTACVARCDVGLGAFPDTPLLWLFKGMALRHVSDTPEAKDAQALIKQAIESGKLPPAFVILGAKELAYIHEEARDFSAAYQTFLEANRVYHVSKGITSDTPPELIQQAKTIYNFATQDIDVERLWQAPANESVPAPVFLLGFACSGVDVIQQALAATTYDHITIHSAFLHLSLSSYKTPTANYPLYLQKLAPEKLGDLRSLYYRQVRNAMGNICDRYPILDASIASMQHILAIRSIFPGAKIIMVHRDPKDMLIDCVREVFDPNAFTLYFKSLETAAAYYDACMKAFYASVNYVSRQIIHTCRYEALLSSFDSEFAKLMAFVDPEYNGKKPTLDELNVRYKPGAAADYEPLFASVDPILKQHIDVYNELKEYVA